LALNGPQMRPWIPPERVYFCGGWSRGCPQGI